MMNALDSSSIVIDIAGAMISVELFDLSSVVELGIVLIVSVGVFIVSESVIKL